jgi:class 3 adenylate cyclase
MSDCFNYETLERAGRFRSGTFSVIFTDIVQFTQFGDNRKLRKGVRSLQNAIVDIFEELHWDEPGRDNEVVMLPTGDGYGIAFDSGISDVDILTYAVELSNTLKEEGYPIRVGINKGPCFVYKDLNDHLNLVGWGIIDAERAMSCGEKNHILCTKDFAKQCLDQKGDPGLHDVGEYIAKERKLHLFNYHSDGFGCEASPNAKRRVRKRRAPKKRTGRAVK